MGVVVRIVYHRNVMEEQKRLHKNILNNKGQSKDA